MTSFYDLLQPGMTQHLGSHTFSRDEIIEFASQFDPQPFHLSEDAAAKSHFGALCASGWHTISVWMSLNVAHGRQQLIALTGYEGPDPMMGPSPGVRNIRWSRPVYVGDTITYSSTITGKKPSTGRPGWATVLSRSEGVNQDGQTVLTMDGAVTMPM